MVLSEAARGLYFTSHDSVRRLRLAIEVYFDILDTNTRSDLVFEYLISPITHRIEDVLFRDDFFLIFQGKTGSGA